MLTFHWLEMGRNMMALMAAVIFEGGVILKECGNYEESGYNQDVTERTNSAEGEIAGRGSRAR